MYPPHLVVGKGAFVQKQSQVVSISQMLKSLAGGTFLFSLQDTPLFSACQLLTRCIVLHKPVSVRLRCVFFENGICYVYKCLFVGHDNDSRSSGHVTASLFGEVHNKADETSGNGNVGCNRRTNNNALTQGYAQRFLLSSVSVDAEMQPLCCKNWRAQCDTCCCAMSLFSNLKRIEEHFLNSRCTFIILVSSVRSKRSSFATECTTARTIEAQGLQPSFCCLAIFDSLRQSFSLAKSTLKVSSATQ